MWWQAIMIGAGIVLAAFAFVRSRCKYHFHGAQSFGTNCEPNIDHEKKLGTCCHCRGSVDIYNGYKIPCQHVAHYTCAMSLKLKFGFGSDWIIEGCKDCLKNQKNRQKLHKSVKIKVKQDECSICFTKIADNPKIFKCNHRSHQTCWNRINEAGLTECPICREYL